MSGSPHSLQGRLVALVLTAVTGVWLAAAAMTWFDARHELDELLDGHLAQAAALLVAQAHEEADEDHGIDTPTLHRYAPKVAFQVFHERRLVLRSANAPTAPMLESGRHFRSGFATVTIGGMAWRVFATEGDEGDVRVYVGEQTRSRTSILWAVLRSTLWPILVALPLLALAVWWAVYRGVGPLRRLGRILAERQPHVLDPVALDGAPSEMAPMIEALNQLFGRIGALLESERRFTADAAHELRTPIAAIRAQAQVALAETDDVLRRRALLQTLEGCDRATRLAEQLLTLSRLEAADSSDAPAMMPVDLAALAQRVVAELAPKALAKDQTLEFDAPQACAIAGNDTLLAVLVRNLVDNAVRYSPPGARVAVTVKREGDRIVLGIDDSGPGLADAELRRLGERFFRALGSAESGSGLGWSIVRRIAAAHRLDVQAGRSQTLGGLAVRVSGRAGNAG
jgi:two-component system, OmpR family, sensor histidine kinase QseC